MTSPRAGSGPTLSFPMRPRVSVPSQREECPRRWKRPAAPSPEILMTDVITEYDRIRGAIEAGSLPKAQSAG